MGLLEILRHYFFNREQPTIKRSNEIPPEYRKPLEIVYTDVRFVEAGRLVMEGKTSQLENNC